MQLRTTRGRAPTISGRRGPSTTARERSPLTTETRHSAMLLGGAIGLMSLFALLLFLGTSWLAR
jgi:hypothetical protein